MIKMTNERKSKEELELDSMEAILALIDKYF